MGICVESLVASVARSGRGSLPVGRRRVAAGRRVDPVPWAERAGPLRQHRSARHMERAEGIVWKTPIAGRGWSSPVTLDGSIWLTTATGKRPLVAGVCLAADTGKVRWDVEVFHADNPQHINAKNSHASPSPIVEPGRALCAFRRDGDCLPRFGDREDPVAKPGFGHRPRRRCGKLAGPV